jgi:hypothetical protein
MGAIVVWCSMRELRWGVELVIEPARRVKKELPLLDDD